MMLWQNGKGEQGRGIGNSGVGKEYLSKDVKGVGTELCGHVRVRQRGQLMQRPGSGNVPYVLRDIRR